jgi:hypothetical protein
LLNEEHNFSEPSLGMVGATGYQADGTEVTMWFTYRFEDYLKHIYLLKKGTGWTLFENPADLSTED